MSSLFPRELQKLVRKYKGTITILSCTLKTDDHAAQYAKAFVIRKPYKHGLYRKIFTENALNLDMEEEDGKLIDGYATSLRVPYKSLREERYYNHGKKNGLLRIWFYTGEIALEFGYKDGYMNGQGRNWYKTGQLATETTYKKDMKEGIYKEWYSDGKMKKQSNYKDGKEIF